MFQIFGQRQKTGAAAHKKWSRSRRTLRSIESEITRLFKHKIQESSRKAENSIEVKSWQRLSQAEQEVQLRDSCLKKIKSQLKSPKAGRTGTRDAAVVTEVEAFREATAVAGTTVGKEETSLVEIPGQLLER